MALLLGGTAFTGIAGLAMLLKIYSKHIHRWFRAREERRGSTDTEPQHPMDAGNVQGLQMVQTPSVQTRNRAHVRFQVDGTDGPVVVLDDRDTVLERASGHELRS